MQNRAKEAELVRELDQSRLSFTQRLRYGRVRGRGCRHVSQSLEVRELRLEFAGVPGV
jgi:hypothetical protein